MALTKTLRRLNMMDNLRPLRVLAVSQYGSVQTGGAERYLYETCIRLRQHGVTVESLHADGALRKLELARPWRVFSSGFHPAWRATILRRLRKDRPDVIYAHFTVPGLVDVAVRCARTLEIPVCLVYHSDVTGADLLRRALGAAYHRLLGKTTLKCADTIIVASRESQDASPWLAACHHSTMHYVSPGVDDAMADGVRSAATSYLLFVGKSQVKSKGFAVLHEAWRRLRRKHAGLGLMSVGSIPKRPYPGVDCLGQVTDRTKLADLYASAAATVLPSTTTAESFGMVLAEALVAGCPVVGSKIGGLAAVITPGVNGYLADPGDAVSLAEALDRVLREQEPLRARIRQQDYRGRFSWEKTALQTLEALRSTLDKG